MKSLSDTKSFEQWFETSNWPEDSYYTNCARDAWLASAEVKDREYGLLLLEKNRLEAVQHDKVKQRDEVVDAIHKEFYNGKNSACNCMGAKCLNTNCKAFWKFAVDEPRYIKMLIEVSASRILELEKMVAEMFHTKDNLENNIIKGCDEILDLRKELDATREQVKEATRLLKCFKQTQGICTEELEAWLAGIKASTNQNTGQGEK